MSRKVCVGYAVAKRVAGRRLYLTARHDRPPLETWWTEYRAFALRMSRSMARRFASCLRAVRWDGVAVVRLVRTVETPLPGQAE